MLHAEIHYESTTQTHISTLETEQVASTLFQNHVITPQLPTNQRSNESNFPEGNKFANTITMASDNRYERLWGALAVALVVFLTYEKRRRARTLAEYALTLDGLENMVTAEGEESGDGDGPRVKCTRQAHPRSDFSRYVTLESTECFADTFSHPVRVLGACAAGKAPKVVLVDCEGRGREAESTCRAERPSTLLLILPKM